MRSPADLHRRMTAQGTITNAKNGINSYLGGNIQAVLEALDPKMNKGGIVVLSLYAQYFNDQNDECTNQNWGWPLGGLRLSTSHREQFNELVIQTNTAIELAALSTPVNNMKLMIADWDAWPQLTHGQMCEPGASPNPDDPSNSNLLFFKLDTSPVNLGDAPMRPLVHPLKHVRV